MAQVGIVEKLNAAMQRLKQLDPRAFVDRLYKPDLDDPTFKAKTRDEKQKLYGEIDHMKDNVENWLNGKGWRNQNLLLIFDKIGRALQLNHDLGASLIECSLDAYQKILHSAPIEQNVLSVASASVISSRSAGEMRPVAAQHSPTISGSESKLHRLYFDILAKYDAAEREKQFEDGHLDQKILYLDYQSLDHWTNLVNCRIYTTYWDCLAALSLLVESPTWSNFFQDSKVCSLYILGAGAPDKDYVIIKSLARGGLYSNNNKLNYIILDTSLPMLAYTIDRLHELTKFQDHMDQIELAPVLGDFLELRRFRRHLAIHSHNKRAGFLIPGGTICNINERNFLSMISQVARAGDFLVIGAEFINPGDRDGYKNRLGATYGSEFVRDLTLTPIRNILSERRISKDKGARRDLIHVDVKDPGGWRYSAVPDAMTVLVDIHLPENLEAGIPTHKSTLAVINRYDEATFIKFVESYGFELSGKYPPEPDALYKQIAFTRV